MFIYAKRLSIAGGLILAALLLTQNPISEQLAEAQVSASDIIGVQDSAVIKLSNALSLPLSWNGNIDCQEETPLTCIVGAKFGYVNQEGSVKFLRAKYYHRVLDYPSGRPRLIPIPNSDSVITYNPNTVYGDYLFFTKNFYGNIQKFSPLGQDEVQYQITKPPDGKLADKSGHLLAGDYESISFSANGGWMIVSVPNVAVVRVNLATYDILPFASGFDYSIGMSPSLQTAISNDGRYAVVASREFSRFEIYDLDNCSAVPDRVTGPVGCRLRNMHKIPAAKQIDLYGANNIRFINDNSLSLYSKDADGIAKYILTADQSRHYGQEYLALGDSYISGEGAYEYLPTTDTADNQCHVSSLSYPLLIGYELNFNSYHSVSCSGARTADIIDSSANYRGQAKPHLSRKDLDASGATSNIINNFNQGYLYQGNFVAEYQPGLITISIGGNDIGFSKRLQSCLWIKTCYDTYEDRLEFVGEVNGQFDNIVNTYKTLKYGAPPGAKIYAIGYPQIAKSDGDCAINVHLDKRELDFASQTIAYLDKIIQLAAAKAGVYYVDTQDALLGHRLCENSPSNIAVDGITAGNDFPDFLGGPVGRESFHPNRLGHQLLEAQILELTNSLSKTMPQPDDQVKLPAIDNLEILKAPHTGRQVSQAQYSPYLSNDVLFKDASMNITLNGEEESLAPLADYRAELHSETIYLGNIKSDTSGNISTSLKIPGTADTGMHAIHFYGLNNDGTPVDVYKYVFIASTSTDFDGDGLSNSTDSCIFISQSGVDTDQDGIDDYCDGNIAAKEKKYDGLQPSSVVFLQKSTKESATVLGSNNTNVLAASKNADDFTKLAQPTASRGSSPGEHTAAFLEFAAFGIIMSLIWKFSG